MTTLSPAPPGTRTSSESEAVLERQHPLPLSILLHLLPGAALVMFVVLAAPTAESFGIPAAFTLFLGIPLVIVPLELGYLLVHAKRTTGSFALRSAVSYRNRLPRRQLAGWAAGLAAWFMVLFLASTMLLDEWLAENLFAWLPDAILQMSSVESDGEPTSAVVMAIVVVVAVVFNGVVGPVVEELYFRGHLLPRIARFGRWAPVINTVLFSLYHFWTPWQNPARIVGFLPIAWTAWRKRSVQVAIAAHVTVNLVFLALFLTVLLAGLA